MENQEEGLGAAFPPSLFPAGCASGFQRKQRMRRGTKGFNALECLFSSFLQHRWAVGLSQRTCTEPRLSLEAEGGPHAPRVLS